MFLKPLDFIGNFIQSNGGLRYVRKPQNIGRAGCAGKHPVQCWPKLVDLQETTPVSKSEILPQKKVGAQGYCSPGTVVFTRTVVKSRLKHHRQTLLTRSQHLEYSAAQHISILS